MKMIRCRTCGELKPVTEYYKQRLFPTKGDGICKSCWSLECKKYYQKNKERCKDNFQRYWKANREKHTTAVRRWVENNRWFIFYVRAKHYAKENNIKFDLTAKDYKELLKPPKICDATGSRLRFNRVRSKYDSPHVSRKVFKNSYSRKNMEVVNKESFYKKLNPWARSFKKGKKS